MLVHSSNAQDQGTQLNCPKWVAGRPEFWNRLLPPWLSSRTELELALGWDLNPGTAGEEVNGPCPQCQTFMCLLFNGIKRFIS